MRFFDCNTYVGLPMNPPPGQPARPGVSAQELLAAMDRAGIEKALVWHVAQRDYDPLAGNELLAEAIAGHDRLAGCWTLLPPQCRELGDLDEWLARAAAAGVRAFRAFGQENRYLLRGEALGDVLSRLAAARRPLILSVGKEWQAIYDLLAEFPDLTVILTDLECWGTDRYFRPLIERYPNVCVEISGYIVDGGIEAFVGDYGPRRMLFGSGFPAAYHGGMMLALARAEISEQDKQAIAADNLDRLLGEVRP
jgi:predicted TIM-barrel fold metal-dependent hydrolase